MTENFWRNLVEMSLSTDEEEITCVDCFEILDEYVDLLDDGQDPSKVFPQLEQHLAMCHCCHTELKAIMTALKAAADDPPS